MKTNDDGRLLRMTQWRRDLHRIPEIGLDVFKTREYLVRELQSMGYTPDLSWGKSAVIVAIPAKQAGPSIAFRADTDALTVTEMTGLSFESAHEGCMHACGHDGHMAALLGFADWIKDRKHQLEKPIVLIFQPGEEGPGGAEILVTEGLMETLHIECIYGFHLFPGLPEGKIGLKAGPFMAQNGEVDIRVIGTSCHGAQPQQGADAIVAAADLILRLQTILSRSISPMDPAVLTFGRIEGGERCNVIAGEVVLNGTMRAFRDDVFRTVQEKIIQQAKGTETAFGVQVEVVFREMYPAVSNAPFLVDRMLRHMDPLRVVMMEAQMLAEDFAFYQQRVPGVFFFLGTGNPEKGYTAPLHNGCFNFDENVLTVALDAYEQILNDHEAFGAGHE